MIKEGVPYEKDSYNPHNYVFAFPIQSPTHSKKKEELNAIEISTISFSFIGPWAGIYLFCGSFLEIMQSHPKALNSLASVAILAIMSSAIAVIIFNKLISI